MALADCLTLEDYSLCIRRICSGIVAPARADLWHAAQECRRLGLGKLEAQLCERGVVSDSSAASRQAQTAALQLRVSQKMLLWDFVLATGKREHRA